MKWTKELIEKLNEEFKNLPSTITNEDVLKEANKQLGTRFTEINVGVTKGDFNTKEDYMNDKDFFKNAIKNAKITLGTCPHCNKWYPKAASFSHKRTVTECVPTYSKEMKRFYVFKLVMCPDCRKDYAQIYFKDDRYERNGKKTYEYREAIAFNPDDERYPDELIIGP